MKIYQIVLVLLSFTPAHLMADEITLGHLYKCINHLDVKNRISEKGTKILQEQDIKFIKFFSTTIGYSEEPNHLVVLTNKGVRLATDSSVGHKSPEPRYEFTVPGTDKKFHGGDMSLHVGGMPVYYIEPANPNHSGHFKGDTDITITKAIRLAGEALEKEATKLGLLEEKGSEGSDIPEEWYAYFRYEHGKGINRDLLERSKDNVAEAIEEGKSCDRLGDDRLKRLAAAERERLKNQQNRLAKFDREIASITECLKTNHSESAAPGKKGSAIQ